MTHMEISEYHQGLATVHLKLAREILAQSDLTCNCNTTDIIKDMIFKNDYPDGMITPWICTQCFKDMKDHPLRPSGWTAWTNIVKAYRHHDITVMIAENT